MRVCVCVLCARMPVAVFIPPHIHSAYSVSSGVAEVSNSGSGVCPVVAHAYLASASLAISHLWRSKHLLPIQAVSGALMPSSGAGLQRLPTLPAANDQMSGGAMLATVALGDLGSAMHWLHTLIARTDDARKPVPIALPEPSATKETAHNVALRNAAKAAFVQHGMWDEAWCRLASASILTYDPSAGDGVPSHVSALVPIAAMLVARQRASLRFDSAAPLAWQPSHVDRALPDVRARRAMIRAVRLSPCTLAHAARRVQRAVEHWAEARFKRASPQSISGTFLQDLKQVIAEQWVLPRAVRVLPPPNIALASRHAAALQMWHMQSHGWSNAGTASASQAAHAMARACWRYAGSLGRDAQETAVHALRMLPSMDTMQAAADILGAAGSVAPAAAAQCAWIPSAALLLTLTVDISAARLRDAVMPAHPERLSTVDPDCTPLAKALGIRNAGARRLLLGLGNAAALNVSVSRMAAELRTRREVVLARRAEHAAAWADHVHTLGEWWANEIRRARARSPGARLATAAWHARWRAHMLIGREAPWATGSAAAAMLDSAGESAAEAATKGVKQGERAAKMAHFARCSADVSRWQPDAPLPSEVQASGRVGSALASAVSAKSVLSALQACTGAGDWPAPHDVRLAVFDPALSDAMRALPQGWSVDGPVWGEQVLPEATAARSSGLRPVPPPTEPAPTQGPRVMKAWLKALDACAAESSAALLCDAAIAVWAAHAEAAAQRRTGTPLDQVLQSMSAAACDAAAALFWTVTEAAPATARLAIAICTGLHGMPSVSREGLLAAAGAGSARVIWRAAEQALQ